MRPPKYLFFTTLIAVLTISCEKETDSTQPVVNPTIQFRSDSGYVFLDDTVGIADTLHVGVIIDRGTGAMHHFKVMVRYDLDDAIVTDSLPIGSDEFEFEKTIITREIPGTEKWSFNVIENDGDLIRRSLTFVVQE